METIMTLVLVAIAYGGITYCEKVHDYQQRNYDVTV